jgi:hypothetical protein
MTRPSFNTSISLGNILTLVPLLVAGAVAWAQVQGMAASNERSIAALRADVTRQESRLRATEMSSARTDERLSSILGLLTRIDARLERIEGR